MTTSAPATGPVAWLRTNLFSSWRDAVLTVIFGIFLLALGVSVLGWLLTEDWKIIQLNMRNFLVGPGITKGEVWAPAIGAFLIAFCMGLLAGALRRRELEAREDGVRPVPSLSGLAHSAREAVSRYWPLIALLLFILLLSNSAQGWLITGVTVGLFLIGRLGGVLIPGARALPAIMALAFISPIIAVGIIRYGFGIEWRDWGGFLLVLFAGAAGIIFAFPLGLILALGRRSKLPVIRALSVGWIEFFRGVPLVVLLFIGSLVLGFLLPRSLIPDELIRAIIILIIFTSAYIAEIVRGGLQSLPPGQEEASKALGMPAWRTMSFIVLPQALRNVIPALVGQAISLWKDTSLLFILGFAEPLRLASVFTRQPDFRGQGLLVLTLFFAALIYWVVSFTMSRESQRLEKKLGVGTR